MREGRRVRKVRSESMSSMCRLINGRIRAGKLKERQERAKVTLTRIVSNISVPTCASEYSCPTKFCLNKTGQTMTV